MIEQDLLEIRDWIDLLEDAWMGDEVVRLTPKEACELAESIKTALTQAREQSHTDVVKSPED